MCYYQFGDNMDALIYSLVFVVFLIIAFYILRAMKLERLFPQGKVFEIRATYLIFSIIIAYLMTEFIYRIISFTNLL